MAMIKVLKFEGPEGVLAWKYPHSELGTWSQLVVNETQEALLFKNGQALDLFGPGRHTLSTQNIPLLQSVINLPFGGDSPFQAEVWYVNKVHLLDVKWGTPTPLQLQDPKYQVLVTVRSYGQFGVQIADSRKFLLKLMGTLPVFDKDSLVQYFRGLLLMNISEWISSYLINEKVSILEISSRLSEISNHIRERVAPVFEQYGIAVQNFYIESINMPEDNPVTVRLREALAKKAEMDIMGYNYQQERTFDTLEAAAKNEGGGNAGVMGAGIGLGMGVSVGGAFGSQMFGLTQQMNASAYDKKCTRCNAMNRQDAQFCMSCGQSLQVPPNVPDKAAETTCAECGNTFPAGAKFCPHCGDPNRPCLHCGADNPQGAKHCHQCGRPIGGALTCGKCGHEVSPGQKFCLECGNKLTE
ncbi:SPFH domain-containing protein [Cohnella caldifontis]|uniref:SPFH domain-containing protein n=1 Tax=Cohnella caldifontis TaxID=3027471 RepID=UPI0023EDB712|nr:SPFH domain-containing protein [Cohnella sp. YIM B05605]